MKHMLERVLFYLTVFLVAFIPLYPKFPLFNIPGTFVAIRIEDLLILVIAILFIIHLYLNQRLSFLYKDRLSKLMILFFGIGAISLFSGIFLTQTVTDPHIGLFHYFRRVEMMILLPIAYTVFKTKKDLRLAILVFILTVLLTTLYALGQQYLNWPVVSTTNSEFSKGLILYLTPGARVNSTFAGHYDLAVFLVMALIILSALFFAIKNLLAKGFVIGLMGLSFFVLVLTAARLSFAAFLAGIIFFLIISKKKVFILLIVLMAIGVMIYPSQLRDRIISTIEINLLQQGERYAPRNEAHDNRSKLNIPTLKVKSSSDATSFATGSSSVASDIVPGEPLDTTDLGVYRSFGIRLNLEWPRAIRAFTKNPFLGTGYSSLGLATDNDILRSLGEVGLLGTVSLAFILIYVFKRIWPGLKESDLMIKYFCAGVLAIIVAFVVNGLFIDVFESSKIAAMFWLLVGIAMAMEKNEHN